MSFTNDSDRPTTALLKYKNSRNSLKNYETKIFIESFTNESEDSSKSFANDFFSSITALRQNEKIDNCIKIFIKSFANDWLEISNSFAHHFIKNTAKNEKQKKFESLHQIFDEVVR